MKYFHIRVDFLDGHEPLTQRYGLDQDVRLRVRMYSKTQKGGGGSNRVCFTCTHVDDDPDPVEDSFTLRVDLTVHAPYEDVEARWTTWDSSTHAEAFPHTKEECVLIHHRYQNHVAVTVTVR